ncbi:hypothetical protein [Streptomyces goshikiensis]|uniref:hypothetical protein n=1 Tax=Streptomyces goshikiensis TaxID=1942 RepID=UPI0036BE7EF4
MRAFQDVEADEGVRAGEDGELAEWPNPGKRVHVGGVREGRFLTGREEIRIAAWVADQQHGLLEGLISDVLQRNDRSSVNSRI